MRKQILALLLTVAILAGVIPAHAMAEETEKFTGVPPQIISVGADTSDGTEISVSQEHASKAYNAVAPADVDTVEEKVDWIAAQCRAEGLTDEWDIALWLHDWLVYNANYDYTFSNYDPSGVLLKGTGVCQSYAEAYCLLLDEFSIENMLLLAPEMNHAWNLVKLDGQWCHVDCTWDDPGEGGYEGYTYFGMDDALMGRDHVWNTGIYPACTSKNNYYYVRTGEHVGSSPEEMEQIFHEILTACLADFSCIYIGTDVNYSVMDALVEYLDLHGSEYGLRSWQVSGTNIWVEGIGFTYFGGAHSHTYTPTVTEPTCMTGGYTTHTCICGDSYTDSSVAALGHNMGTWQTLTEATCGKDGSQIQTCQRSGCDFSATGIIPATGKHTYTDEEDATCNVCGYRRSVEVETVSVYRLYNPYTQEHLLTGGVEERDALISVGWSLDGVAWEAPVEGIPVYRLYNPYDDWHTYTTSTSERDTMVAAGWTVDGVVSFGYTGKDGRPIYRLFNPYVQTNYHLFTAGAEERDQLVSVGWILEGTAWYAAP